jgi:type VI secretion system protein ImpF
MPKPESDVSVTPSLIDRLIDANPSSQVEAPATRSQSVREIKKALRRDMEWLLNTRRNPEERKVQAMEELRESLYRYGLPDFSSHSIHSSRDRSQLLSELERTIALFEPRLTHVRITQVEDADGPLRTLHFQIEGLLDMDPAPERISFDTMLQLTSGEYQIRGERGA